MLVATQPAVEDILSGGRGSFRWLFDEEKKN